MIEWKTVPRNLLQSPILEQGSKDIDKEPLSGDLKDNSVILDTKVDML
jgi:hypothetical protein